MFDPCLDLNAIVSGKRSRNQIFAQQVNTVASSKRKSVHKPSKKAAVPSSSDENVPFSLAYKLNESSSEETPLAVVYKTNSSVSQLTVATDDDESVPLDILYNSKSPDSSPKPLKSTIKQFKRVKRRSASVSSNEDEVACSRFR